MPKQLNFNDTAWKSRLDVVTANEPRDAFTSIEAPIQVLWDNANFLRRELNLKPSAALLDTRLAATLAAANSYANDNFSRLGHTHNFGSITGKPSTAEGYGITNVSTTSRWQLSFAGSINAATIASAGRQSMFTVRPTVPDGRQFIVRRVRVYSEAFSLARWFTANGEATQAEYIGTGAPNQDATPNTLIHTGTTFTQPFNGQAPVVTFGAVPPNGLAYPTSGLYYMSVWMELEVTT